MSLDFDNMCRLCLAPEDLGGDIVLSSIQQFLPLLDLFGLRHADKLPQKICSTCQFQIESSQLLRKRVQYTNHLWMKFRNVQHEPSLDMLMSCHICNQSFDVQSLVFHIRQVHGEDHLINCVFCKILQENSKVESMPVSFVKEEDPMRGIESEYNVVFPEEIPEMESDDASIDSDTEDDEKTYDYNNDDDGGENRDESSDENDSDSDEDWAMDTQSNDNTKTSEISLKEKDPSAFLYRKKENSVYPCNLCPMKTTTVHTLIRHIKRFHGQMICSLCSFGFVDSNAQTEHELEIKNDSPDKTYPCDNCDKVFKSFCEQRKHTFVHIAQKDPSAFFYRRREHSVYPCNLCPMKTTTVHTLIRHIKRLHGQMICSLCSFGFVDLNAQTEHELEIRNDSPDKTYPCDNCDKVFTSFCEQRKHTFEHIAQKSTPRPGTADEESSDENDSDEDEDWAMDTQSNDNTKSSEISLKEKDPSAFFYRKKPNSVYPCNLCPMTTTAVHTLIRHIKRMHGPTICSLCSFGFEGIHAQTEHDLEKRNGSADKTYRCDYCKKVFKSFCEQRKHTLAHIGQKLTPRPGTASHKYVIALESMPIGRGPQLVDRDEKPFQCNLCSLKFSLACLLRRHMKRKHAENHCPKCTFSTIDKKQLEAHEMERKAGSGHSIYSCEYCYQTFKTYCGKMKHTLRHIHAKDDPITQIPINEAPINENAIYQCNMCVMRASTIGSLNSHIKTRHGEISCRICSFGFEEKKDFENHENERINGAEDDSYPCNYCSQSFNSFCAQRKHTWKHVTNHHIPRDEPSTSHANNPAKRMRTDSNEPQMPSKQYANVEMEIDGYEPYSCNACSKKTVRARYMYRHFTKYHGVFFCRTCIFVFENADNLMAHAAERRESTEMSFPCTQCDAVFTSLCAQREHILTHITKFQCTTCKRPFPFKRALTDHMLVAHNLKPQDVSFGPPAPIYPCNVCSVKLSTLRSLHLHLTRHGEYICKQCMYGCANKEEFDQHSLERMNQNSGQEYNCDKCDLTFGSFCEQREHSWKHMLKHKCPHCTMRFFKSREMFDHVTKEHSSANNKSSNAEDDNDLSMSSSSDGDDNEEVPDSKDTPIVPESNTSDYFVRPIYDCNLCKVKTSSATSLFRHIKGHGYGFSCRLCLYGFVNQEDFGVHETERANGSKDKTYPCEKCSVVSKSFCEKREHDWKHALRFKCGQCAQRFNTTKDLHAHRAVVHRSYKDVSCNLCGINFDTKYARTLHMNSQHKTMIICDICGKCLPKSRINTHRKRHDETPHHKCTFEGCKLAYFEKNSLLKHMEVHSDVRKYKCKFPNCEMAFKQRSALQVHTMKHTSEKKFRCNWEGCEKAFFIKSDLLIHGRRHTNEKPFQCSGCAEAFYTNSLLRKHQQDCNFFLGQ